MRMMADTYNRYVIPLSSRKTATLQDSQSQASIISKNSMLTYLSLQQSCQKKCIPTDYREGELNKGESVCLDRCTAKFLDTSMKVSEIMQQQGQAMGGQQGGGLF